MLVTSIAFVLLPKIFTRFYNSDKWTIGRSLLNNVCYQHEIWYYGFC
jgi:hypothetical protein